MTVTSQLHAILCSYLWLNIGYEEGRGFKEGRSGGGGGGDELWGKKKTVLFTQRTQDYCSEQGL